MSKSIDSVDRYDLRLPSELAEEPDLWKTKGYLFNVELIVASDRFVLSVRDPVRLRQDLDVELSIHGYFSEKNLLVVSEVSEAAIRRAVERIVERGDFSALVSEKSG